MSITLVGHDCDRNSGVVSALYLESSRGCASDFIIQRWDDDGSCRRSSIISDYTAASQMQSFTVSISTQARVHAKPSSTTGGCLPPKCSCADPLPKMDYILDSSPLTKVDGGVMILHEAEEDAVNWMNSVATITLAKTIRCNLHVAAAQNDVTLVLSRAAHTIGKVRWPQ